MMDDILKELEYHAESCEKKHRQCELEEAKAAAFAEGLRAGINIVKGMQNDTRRREA